MALLSAEWPPRSSAFPCSASSFRQFIFRFVTRFLPTRPILLSVHRQAHKQGAYTSRRPQSLPLPLILTLHLLSLRTRLLQFKPLHLIDLLRERIASFYRNAQILDRHHATPLLSLFPRIPRSFRAEQARRSEARGRDATREKKREERKQLTKTQYVCTILSLSVIALICDH